MCAELLGEWFQRTRIDICQGDVRAFSCKTSGNGSAQPAAGTEYQRGFFFKDGLINKSAGRNSQSNMADFQEHGKIVQKAGFSDAFILNKALF